MTGHKGLQAIAAFGEKVMFKYTTDKTKRNKMDSEWDTGYFVGINSRTSEYLIAKGAEVFSSTTVRRLTEDKAYDPEVVQDVKIQHREYITEGARSSPVGVRMHTAAPSSVEGSSADSSSKNTSEAGGLRPPWVHRSVSRMRGFATSAHSEERPHRAMPHQDGT